jgi:putative membrane protein insertion efficiency factor
MFQLSIVQSLAKIPGQSRIFRESSAVWRGLRRCASATMQHSGDEMRLSPDSSRKAYSHSVEIRKSRWFSVIFQPSVWPRRAAHILIRAYQLSLSAFIGRRCRYLPTCSEYTDEAITRHGLWAGGFMGVARLCRCHPWGGSGYDPVPTQPALGAHWALPWRYGHWRQRPTCEAVAKRDDAKTAP